MPGGPRSLEDELTLCERFLDLSRTGNRGPEFRSHLEKLYPVVRKEVLAVCSRWGRLPDHALDPQDVVQELFAKLQTSPPVNEPKRNARVTFLTWVKTCAHRILIDINRKHSPMTVPIREECAGSSCDPELGGRLDTEYPEERFRHAHWIEKFYEYLRDNYPKGADYVESIRSNPQATSRELAKIMGVTRTNLDQIASRTRQHAVRFRQWIAS